MATYEFTTVATYEFISLKCVKPNELGGDEIYVEYGGPHAFPGVGSQAKFSKGDAVVNPDAMLEGIERRTYLEPAGARPLESYGLRARRAGRPASWSRCGSTTSSRATI